MARSDPVRRPDQSTATTSGRVADGGTPLLSRPMDLRLDGKVALVTGASRGIGLAIAQAMAASGARVMLSSRKPDALEEAVRTIDGEAAWFAANAGDPGAAEQCVEATI